jgi:hypothetical protein
VFVTCRQWPQREAFLAALRAQLAATWQRVAYYPGSKDKIKDFCRRFPAAEALGKPVPSAASGDPQCDPFYLAAGLTPEQADGMKENWCCVLQVQSTSQVLRLHTGFPCKVLCLTTKPEVSCAGLFSGSVPADSAMCCKEYLQMKKCGTHCSDGLDASGSYSTTEEV